MHRVICQLGGLTITSWGLMLVIAFASGIWLAGRRTKKYGIPYSIVGDLSIILIVAGVIGGRIEFVVENFSQYADNPGDIFKVWEGGLIFYGGLLLAIISGIIFLKIKKINLSDALNTFAPSVALGLFFARIGCFLNGCCFGKPTNLPWAVIFPPDSPAGWVFKEETPVHPTQLYSALAGLFMFGILLLLEKSRGTARRAPTYGYLFWVFLILYSVWRFCIDFIRYYEAQAYVIGYLTHNQLLSIIIFILSLGIVLKNEFLKRHT